jgi:hypothetical protein
MRFAVDLFFFRFCSVRISGTMSQFSIGFFFSTYGEVQGYTMTFSANNDGRQNWRAFAEHGARGEAFDFDPFDL